MVKAKRGVKSIMYFLGLLLVLGTHIGILAMGLPQEFVTHHAVTNLVAGVLIFLGVSNKI